VFFGTKSRSFSQAGLIECGFPQNPQKKAFSQKKPGNFCGTAGPQMGIWPFADPQFRKLSRGSRDGVNMHSTMA
jgi:hypothetical protein